MSKCKGIALAGILMLAWATPALAAKSVPLLVGGRTLGGPGTASLAPNATVTVYTDADGSADACATVVVSGSAAVRLSMVAGTTSTIDVPVGASGALCKDNLQRVDLICLGATNSCSAQWRVDNN